MELMDGTWVKKILSHLRVDRQDIPLPKICGWIAIAIVALLFCLPFRRWNVHAGVAPFLFAGQTWWYVFDYIWENLLFLLHLSAEPHFSLTQLLAVENISPGVFALFVGAALAAPGVSFQAFFQNPISSPSVLGITNACGAGLAVGMVFGLYTDVMSPALFSFPFLLGIGSVLLVVALSILLGRGRIQIDLLILAGVVSSSFFNTIYLAIQYTLEPGKQQMLSGVYLGHLDGLPSGGRAAVFYGVLLVGIVPLFLLRYRMNLLAFGREQAHALGVHANTLGVMILLTGTLVEAVVLLFCGMIGWIGLVVPHIARLCVGADIRRVLPVSMLFGGALLLLAELLGLPAGIGVSIVGVPVFLYLVAKNRGMMV